MQAQVGMFGQSDAMAVAHHFFVYDLALIHHLEAQLGRRTGPVANRQTALPESTVGRCEREQVRMVS